MPSGNGGGTMSGGLSDSNIEGEGTTEAGAVICSVFCEGRVVVGSFCSRVVCVQT